MRNEYRAEEMTEFRSDFKHLSSRLQLTNVLHNRIEEILNRAEGERVIVDGGKFCRWILLKEILHDEQRTLNKHGVLSGDGDVSRKIEAFVDAEEDLSKENRPVPRIQITTQHVFYMFLHLCTKTIIRVDQQY